MQLNGVCLIRGVTGQGTGRETVEKREAVTLITSPSWRVYLCTFRGSQSLYLGN